MNKFLVRFTILFCTIYFLYVLYFAWQGISVFSDSYKVFLEYCLFIQANENKKYNCRYMRFLALSLFITEAISVIDTQFDIIPDGFIALIIFASIWTIGIITTLILAINHFKRGQKAKREKKEINDNLLKPK